MNRLATLLLLALAGLLASCGSSATSSTEPGTHNEYTVVVSPDQFTLNAGDWSTVTATVDLSNQNSAPKAISPQPTIQFSSSDPRVTISPAGEVCAGQWDTKYLTCTPTVFPLSSPSAGLLNLPTGQVTITVFNASHNVSGTTLVTVHPRAASIALGVTAGTYPSTGCVSQNNQVKYNAAPVFAGGATGGTVLDNDYTWTVGDASVASVSTQGFVIAHNPGVTNVIAKLNGTVSTPLAFATCPPSSIVLASSPFTNSAPTGPFSTSDLDINPLNDPTCVAAGTCALNKGDQKFLSSTLFDANGAPLILTLPLTFVTSDTLTGNVSADLPLNSKLIANTSGRFSVMAACEPPVCNAAVADFVSPAGTGPTTGKSLGFGFPIYSNVIGVTVRGITPSTVLVTGTMLASPPPTSPGQPPVELHRLLAYDSEAMTITHTIALQNLPNSLVVAPNGAKAYLGSSAGLMVVNLTSFNSSVQTFPVAGGGSTEVVTGKVLGVSPDSRFVLVSDPTNGLVFLVDTTGTKQAARYTIPDTINAVTFAADGSNTWIAGVKGVYTFNADTFVLTNTNPSVQALAWTPDGQSYFASSASSANITPVTAYSTCDDTPLKSVAGSPINLSTTVLGGVPHVVGLSVSDSEWFDYSVTTTAQVGSQLATLDSGLKPSGRGNVCPSSPVSAVNTANTLKVSLPCTVNQVSFSPTLESEFVTGVDPSCLVADSFIHGYNVLAPTTETKLPTTNANPILPLSGGVLSDGRKLFVGTYDNTTKSALLHRFNLDPTTGPIGEEFATVTTGTAPATVTTVTVPASVELVPSFVAVVPK